MPKALGADRYALKREIIRIRKSVPRSNDSLRGKIEKKLFHLEKQVQASVKKKIRRKENLPEIIYNESLPISAKKEDIIRAISENRVVIISGETGSGKTTQIPKFCLAAGRGIEGKIGCTQPRRIAATTVAHRIAEEFGEELGKSVGYKIRFQDQGTQDAYIKIMTDGILLAETRHDPYLNEYDTIIVDEAHERSLNIDFVLGILKTLLNKRKDLKLIITSATIDTEKFSKAFNSAPIIKVSGRMYPVEVRYDPVEESDDQSYMEAAVQAVYKLLRESRHGDILVFMPTEQDIRETCEMLEAGNLKLGNANLKVEIFPLFARLSGGEQSKVFSRRPGRKIIVSTNVAETSVTIPGIKYVVDSGLARISQYLPRSRTTALPVTSISKSSADQRKGRCGRVENGICIRLYSEADFESRPLFTAPEILRSNLAEVILRMIALNLGDISDFPFVDSPAPKNIKDGFDLLVELSAIVAKTKESKAKNRFSLTEKGRIMARMPIDPRLSRMLIEAETEGCVREMAVLASALSIQDPRERPTEKQTQADQAQAVFKDTSSDFITLLNIWNAYDMLQKANSGGKIRKFCKVHFLSYRRMREWRDIHTQIIRELRDSEIGKSDIHEKQPSEKSDSYYAPVPESIRAGIHKSVLSGFLSNIAVKKEKNIFKATKDKEVMIFPGSGLFNHAGAWIVAAEMVETSRVFARTTANIDVTWLEALGKDQCRYTYMHPHWERNREEVVASEQVSLFGLVIIPKRPVSYGKINPDEASDIFIRSALMEWDVKKPFPFMKHNRKLADDIRDMENRLRKKDILISEEDIYQFYRERLEHIYDTRTLRTCLRKKGDNFLRMKKADLFRYSPDEKELALYPDRIELGNKSFDCDYAFELGKHDDGVTIKVPSTLAPSVPSESLDWLVPGLMCEKMTALIKGLPKAYRKKLVPVGDTVDTIMREIGKSKLETRNSKLETSNFKLPDSALITTLGNFIYDRFGIDIPASAWPSDSLPDHLKMRISVTDPKGKEIRSGRDRAVLDGNISGKIDPDAFESAKKEWERTGITSWDFDDLPDVMTLKGKKGGKWTVCPGLEPGDKCVSLRLFRQRKQAVASHKNGIVTLFGIHFSKDLKFLKKCLSLSGEMKHQAEYFGGAKRFEKRLYESILKDLFCKNIRTKEMFYSHKEAAEAVILTKGKEKLDSVARVMKAYNESRTALYDLEKSNSKNCMAINFFKSLREELEQLVPETFMDLYDTDRIIHIERYIKTITVRAQRGLMNFEKDRIRSEEVRCHSDSLRDLLKGLSPSVSEGKRTAMEEYFWLIEEFKVSLFAQELKTPIPVSPKRLDKKLKDIQRMV